MTVDKLLAEAKTIGPWYMDAESKRIRCKNGDCPLVAVARKKGLLPAWSRDNWIQAGRQLGFTPEEVRQIAAAADINYWPADSVHAQIREQLMALVNFSV